MNYHRPLSRLMLTLLTCVSALKASIVITPANLSIMLASFTQPINLAGLLDQSFGTNGIVTTDVTPGGWNNAYAAVLQLDGKIVAVGMGNVANSFFALARYNSDGSLDESFGTGGKLTTNVTGNDVARAAVLQSDGKIVALGNGNNGVNDLFALVRYNSDGSLDTSFGTGGKLTTNVTGNDVARAALLQSDGKIVAVGQGNNGGGNLFALARYNSDGSLDQSFGTGGKLTTNVTGNDVARAALLQSDGKIVAVGQGTNGHSVFALARYNSDGSMDQSFGIGGTLTTDAAYGGANYANAAVLQPDGKIVAVGAEFDGYNQFALIRYDNPFTLATFTASYGGAGLL